MAETSLPPLTARDRLKLRRAADERLIDAIFGDLFLGRRDDHVPGGLKPAAVATANGANRPAGRPA